MLLPCNLLLKILVKSELVKFMEEKKLSPNAYSYSRVIKTYYKTEKLDLMWQAYEALRKRNLYPCNWAYPGLIHAISADYALDLFEEMLDKRGLPRPRMCKYLIVWLCYRGCSDAALKVYKALKARGAVLGTVLRPSLRMFRCLRNVQTSCTNIMSKELEKIRICDLQEDEHGADMLWNYSSAETKSPSELSPQEYEDLMLAMQAVLYEGTSQEQHPDGLEDYENAKTLEDSSLANLLEQSHQENDVLCPVCRRGYLFDRESSIQCSSVGCLELKNQEKIRVGVEFVRTRLAELMDEHYRSGCSSQPFFTHKFQCLFMLCTACDFFEAVL